MTSEATRAARRAAIGFVVAVAIGSLFADVVYEGARSIAGPFLLTLGASAAFVGFISGLGEFVGYALRIVSGYAADRTGRYWLFTIGGYALNVFAVPLLALAGRIEIAVALLLAERLGKAIRVPARDTMISYASRPIGRGLAFGIHEALDQIGAVLGPLMLAGVLLLRPDDYRFAFAILGVPAVLTVVALFSARVRFPDPRALEGEADRSADAPLAGDGRVLRANAPFWRYGLFSVLAVAGFAPFPLVAFHLVREGVLTAPELPLLYAVAMAVDAVVALATGHLYDRRGLVVLVSVPFVTVASAALFTTEPLLVWAGAVAWGAVMGIQESTLRAAVADLVTVERRATGYGLFNTLYGFALLAGGALMGLLYEASPLAVAVFIGLLEVAALGAIAYLLRQAPRRPSGV